jgi:hypothetical protein
MPRRGLLISVRKLQNFAFSPVRADNLKSDGKTRGRESTGNRDGWQSPHIYWAGVAEQQNFTRPEELWELLQLRNRGSEHRCGWSDQNVYVLKNAIDFAAYFFLFEAPLLNLRAADALALAYAA